MISFSGRVEAIHITADRGEPMIATEAVEAVAGRGLKGDRNFDRVKNDKKRPDKAVTLIEAETLEALIRDHDIELAPGESRRNITTRGVPLNHLVGRRFKVGDAVFEGYELCEPCARLEKLTGKKMISLLLHRGGLRAYIVESGTVRIGDGVEGV